MARPPGCMLHFAREIRPIVRAFPNTADWDDDADVTPVRAAPPSHIRVRRLRTPLVDPPSSLPKLAPVLVLPPELRTPVKRPRPTRPLPLVRWSAATMALPLVHKLELHLGVRRVRARRAWRFAWAGAAFAGAFAIAGCWLARPNMASSTELGAIARTSQAAAASAYARVVIDGPEGARVALDGVDRGRLPLALDALSPGRHTLELDGRPTSSVLVREIEVSGGEVLELGDVEL